MAMSATSISSGTCMGSVMPRRAFLIEGYHSSNEEEFNPRGRLHIGTMEQARMRGGRHLYRITVSTERRMPRLRDEGAWRERILERHARHADIAVYLNRHEGISLEAFDIARESGNIDAMTDANFRRNVLGASDSWIVLNASAITGVERLS